MAAGVLRLLWIAALPLALMPVAPPLRAVPAPAASQFDACLARLQPQALASGIAAATYRMHTAALTPDREVLDLLDAQPEFVTPIWDYLAGLVDDERVAAGRAMLDRHRDVLARVAQRYGVDPATVVAVWGVESDYGQRFGARPVLRSLATLACSGRRQEYFRGELFAALRVVQAGDVDPAQLRGSWAGAFGHTQFMPSTFLRSAVDFDGVARAWPTDDPGLSRVQRRQLQALLLARGHAIGAADGMIGSKTRHAIQAEQRRLKLPDDGRAGQRILRELQAEVVP